MRSDIQTAVDILYRNQHQNPFQLKVPSHNASRDAILLQCRAFVLNKLALVPFFQSHRLTNLYQTVLQTLIESIKSSQDQSLIKGVVQHLQIWHGNMGSLGSWPYTRAAFYVIEQKIKDSNDLLENVVTKRAILQEKKNQFLDKASNSIFKSQSLNQIKNFCNMHGQEIQAQQQKEETVFILPMDIILLDVDEAWNALIKSKSSYDENRQFQKIQKACEYLKQYQGRPLIKYIRREFRSQNDQNQSISSVIKGLQLRQQAYKIYTSVICAKIQQFLSSLAKKLF